ncbi:MAG: zf-HC2 domain-containing protein [Pyrinomonadaceae bacterium]
MNYQNKEILGCSEFEELLSDYLEKNLDAARHKLVAAHALKCPLCHSLLNEVRDALEICHEITTPAAPLTKLEARVLSATMPQTAMSCDEFETHLTDYLDGFLSASNFHKWERHAVLCEQCTDLPGEVVRSIAACYTYKMEEFVVPEGLHNRIMQATVGSLKAQPIKPSWTAQTVEWLREFSFPVSVPQFAPVVMMLVFAFLVFSQTGSVNGSISGMYQKSFEMAGQTYKQGTDLVLGGTKKAPANSEEKPNEGTFIKDSNK